MLLTNLLQQKSTSHLKLYPLKTMDLGTATATQWDVNVCAEKNVGKIMSSKTRTTM